MQLDNSILIYPFNAEAMPLIRSKKFAASYKRVILCALKGSGFNGKDASEVDGGETVGIQVREDLIECLDECSTVLFIESQYIQSDDEDFKQIAYQAALRGKTVINNRGGYQGTSRAYRVDNVQDAYGLFGNVTIDISKDIKYEFNYGDLLKSEGLVDITTPIITVVGTGKNTNKLALQISIIEELEQQGYKVSWIGSNKMCELLGERSFPSFMFEDGITDTEKVLLFNRFVKSVEMSDHADVILIGVPGGIMPCSKNIPGDFGILSYKVFQAVSPDYLILSIFYDDYQDEFFTEIKSHIKYKFSSELNMIHICNRRIDWDEVRVLNQNVIPYYVIGSQAVNNFIRDKQGKVPVELVNIMRKNETAAIVEDIIGRLADDEPNLVF